MNPPKKKSEDVYATCMALFRSGGSLNVMTPPMKPPCSATGTTPAPARRKIPDSASTELVVAKNATAPLSLTTGDPNELKVPVSGAGSGSPLRSSTENAPPLFLMMASLRPKSAIWPCPLGAEKKLSVRPSGGCHAGGDEDARRRARVGLEKQPCGHEQVDKPDGAACHVRKPPARGA